MPPYSELSATIDRVSPADGPLPSRPPGRGRRRGALTTALLWVATLAGFALLMSAMTAPAAGHQHAVHAGPVAADYVPIEAAVAAPTAPLAGPGASTGAFTSRCGRNVEGHRNSDNFITAPGRSNGAHHVHDYVGNTSTDGASTDQSLAAGSTTCTLGDKSVYFWPVLRDIRHAGVDADRPGGGSDGNMGHILTPARVAVQFLGNQQAKVQPMPMFLRVVTGDAKAVTKGSAARARAMWSCSGTPGRASSTLYPLCPAGQQVQRVGEFPSCWTGAGTDSEDHRTHVTFPDRATGACPTGTVAIPRLRITLSYDVPPGRSFAIDSFPDQQRKAVTDHFDFENLMPESLMNHVVDCINTARTC
ncbi:MAG TPA: DUF1996 domain-containing protein [Mycobacteriales bacterium]